MLAATLREAARRFADVPAVVTEDGWALTYLDLDRISDEVAVGLTRRGVQPGDVLALVLPPGPEYLLSYLAAGKLGAITAGVNDRLTAPERATVLERAQPRLVLSAPGTAWATSSSTGMVRPCCAAFFSTVVSRMAASRARGSSRRMAARSSWARSACSPASGRT